MTGAAAQDGLLVLNGIDVDTGDYLAPTFALGDLADALRAESGLPPGARELRRRRHDDEAHLGVVYGRDPENLASVGWAVVVPPEVDPAVLEALQPLLDLRKEQAGDLFQRLELHPGEDKNDFLVRYGMGPGVADPRKVPYYLLVVGTPQQVPFEVQYQLGITYAVGRLDLENPEACAAYAATVVGSEQSPQAFPARGAPAAGTAAVPRRAQLFGTRHPDDAQRLATDRAADVRAAGGDGFLAGRGRRRRRRHEVTARGASDGSRGPRPPVHGGPWAGWIDRAP
jgi:hypothetical protein